MTVRKRKKNTRQRGSKTHGYGAMKKHRGAGSRGGRGMAGTGKRADTKKPSVINKFTLKNYFGKFGFKRPQKLNLKVKTINIGELNYKETDIDLTKLGYTKLLGKGKLNKKHNIKVKSFSKSAKIKVEKAGGTITSNES
ncbi:MAG: uL15m family ribosomal protein [Nanoarchaeota archaeon]